MSESTFLSGKVLKKTLPAFDGPPGSDAPLLKRLLLPQGELAQFHDADEPIRYMAFLELRDGTLRGNHYHELKEEFFYLIQGEVELVVIDLDSGQRESIPMISGDLAFIRQRVAHAFKVRKPGQAIEFSGHRYDPRDTYRHLVQ